MREKQTMICTDLPRELKSVILSKIPATSLSQLWSTCKRWYALFKDLRLGKAATQVIFKKDYCVNLVRINHHGGINNSFDPSIEYTGKLKSLKDLEQVNIYGIFHCNGLLLCTTGNNGPVVVCNPFTGQTRWTPSSDKGYSSDEEYVLGYDKVRDSYKILRFSYYYSSYEFKSALELYEFNSDSWRLLDEATPYFRSNGVNLKGNTYWFASDVRDPPFVKFIIRFDFTSERFERLSLPFQNDDVDETVVLSVVREEKLALLYQNFSIGVPSLEMKIWITNTKMDDEDKDLSWSNFLVVDFDKITEGMSSVMSFLVDEENKLVVCCDTDPSNREEGTRVYIVGEDIHKEVYKGSTKEKSSTWTPLVSYAPSLVQI